MTDLRRLADFFAADDIEFKPIAVSKKTGKALAAAYITNRAVMQRLDDVVGPGNWQNEYRPGPSGGVVCGLSVRVVREDGSSDWVTKWDGADNTDVEAVKGGLSDSMRRAAVHWGIGRYLYGFPQQWVPIDDYGKFAQPPRIPREFLPQPERPAPRPARDERPAVDGPPAHDERPVREERPLRDERAAAPRPVRDERPMRDERASRPEAGAPEAPRGFRPVTR